MQCYLQCTARTLVCMTYFARQLKVLFYHLTAEKILFNDFYEWQQYRQVLLRAHISYGNSVCLSVCLSVWGVMTRYRIKPRSDRDSRCSPYGSLGSLVSKEVIWCRWARRFPSNEGIKEGYPLRNRSFTTIGSSSMRTVADRCTYFICRLCWSILYGFGAIHSQNVYRCLKLRKIH